MDENTHSRQGVCAGIFMEWVGRGGMPGYNKAHVLGETGDDLQHPLLDNADSKRMWG